MALFSRVSSSPVVFSLPRPSTPAVCSSTRISSPRPWKQNRKLRGSGEPRHHAPDRMTRELKSEVSPHRAVATVRLLRIEQGGAYADLLNETCGKYGNTEMGYVERTLGFRIRDLEDRDIRLVTDIVAGAIRWRRYLDYLIMSCCDDERLFQEMEPLLLQILRVGFYEIVKLNMPSYAVVNENVTVAKAALRPGAGNLVNGVLRKLVSLMEKDALPVPTVEGDDRSQARALAIIHSHPVWMVRRWVRHNGQEGAVKLMEWNNSCPSYSLRVNTRKGYQRADLIDRLENLKIEYELSILDEFIRVSRGMQAILHANLLRDGICSVQDESAGLVVYVVDPKPGETIVDCCAAPGGKTLFMAARLACQGMVRAIDINKGRLRILEETAKSHDLDNMITLIHADLRDYAGRAVAKADKVLLDAPCSGLGVLSKRADLRWRRNLEDLEHLTHLQDELLDSASILVKPGGILVYSTCSIDPDENEGRVESFLRRHPEFSLQPVHSFVPPEFVTVNGFFSTSPVKHSMDGSFAARLLRSPC